MVDAAGGSPGRGPDTGAVPREAVREAGREVGRTLAALFQPGEVVSGRVIEQVAPGAWALTVRGRTLVAESAVPLPADTVVRLEVLQQSDGRLRVRIAPDAQGGPVADPVGRRLQELGLPDTAAARLVLAAFEEAGAPLVPNRLQAALAALRALDTAARGDPGAAAPLPARTTPSAPPPALAPGVRDLLIALAAPDDQPAPVMLPRRAGTAATLAGATGPAPAAATAPAPVTSAAAPAAPRTATTIAAIAPAANTIPARDGAPATTVRPPGTAPSSPPAGTLPSTPAVRTGDAPLAPPAPPVSSTPTVAAPPIPAARPGSSASPAIQVRSPPADQPRLRASAPTATPDLPRTAEQRPAAVIQTPGNDRGAIPAPSTPAPVPTPAAWSPGPAPAAPTQPGRPTTPAQPAQPAPTAQSDPGHARPGIGWRPASPVPAPAPAAAPAPGSSPPPPAAVRSAAVQPGSTAPLPTAPDRHPASAMTAAAPPAAARATGGPTPPPTASLQSAGATIPAAVAPAQPRSAAPMALPGGTRIPPAEPLTTAREPGSSRPAPPLSAALPPAPVSASRPPPPPTTVASTPGPTRTLSTATAAGPPPTAAELLVRAHARLAVANLPATPALVALAVQAERPGMPDPARSWQRLAAAAQRLPGDDPGTVPLRAALAALPAGDIPDPAEGGARAVLRALVMAGVRLADLPAITAPATGTAAVLPASGRRSEQPPAATRPAAAADTPDPGTALPDAAPLRQRLAAVAAALPAEPEPGAPALREDQRSAREAVAEATVRTARDSSAQEVFRPRELADYDHVIPLPLRCGELPTPARLAVATRPTAGGGKAAWLR
ncbi:MAG: hypothetical protein L6R48_16285, partial [Planctomycetes bacterium]|nr:hypothetical protein [Planctomycetota bacterium]